MNKIYTIIWFITFFIIAMFINMLIALRQYEKCKEINFNSNSCERYRDF
jgi:hypothetical protein